MRTGKWKIAFLIFVTSATVVAQNNLKINELEYFEMPGLNVMVFQDYYAEGHQSGVTIVQHGSRVAASGDLRIQAAPGQWDPVPKMVKRTINKDNNTITVQLSFPDSSMINRRFNPIKYPNLFLDYEIIVSTIESGVRITVNLNKPVPDEWLGKIGFNLELFPGELFGKSYLIGGKTGIFPRQVNGPFQVDKTSGESLAILGKGNKLLIAPEDATKKMEISSSNNELLLVDGRTYHNNGWYVVRSVINNKKTDGAIVWDIKPNVIENWKYKPVVHTSQLGYHPAQTKKAIIELDKNDDDIQEILLFKYSEDGKKSLVEKAKPVLWGDFQRYKYFTYDFSDVHETGVYIIQYGEVLSEEFSIDAHIFENNVWQPTLEYFLPVQMCHMRVADRYRIWHGACHLDDALMAPVDTVFIDGYTQRDTTYTSFESYEHVPGLDRGGWHDAGDFDLRVESQAGTVRTLGLMVEEFGIDYDQTSINQASKMVQLHVPDGKSDALQQIEHGVISIISGYESLGRLYKGIISPTTEQYVHLGDPATMSDQVPCINAGDGAYTEPCDDRWVFTEQNPRKEITVAGHLAIAGRLLRGFNDTLSQKCILIAEEIIDKTPATGWAENAKIEALVELYISTDNPKYTTEIEKMLQKEGKRFSNMLWTLGRVQSHFKNQGLKQQLNDSAELVIGRLKNISIENPFGVPYRPNIWGAGWTMQEFAVKQYYFNKAWPNETSKSILFNTLNFVLGCHPGENPISFITGVGRNSATTAYGFNRADWSGIPGGVISGTAYIRPDLPELKHWPYFWQQTEYVLGGGASNFIFLVLAVNSQLE